MSGLENLRKDEQQLELLEEMQEQIESQQVQMAEQQENYTRLQNEHSRLQESYSKMQAKYARQQENYSKMQRMYIRFREQKDLQMQQMQSENSLLLSNLTSELQSKSDEIVRLNEKIGTMINADLELAEAKQIMQEAQKKEANAKTILEEAESVRNFNEELIVKAALAKKEAHFEQDKAEKKIKMADEKMRTVDERIENAALRKCCDKEYELKIKYNTMCAAHEGFYIGVLLYGIFVTLLKAIGTKVVRDDVAAAGMWLWKIAIGLYNTARKGGMFVAGISNTVPQKNIAEVLYWIIFVIIFIVIITAPIAATGYGIYRLGKCYYYDLWDRITLNVLLVSIAVIVIFAEEIRSIVSVNVLGLLVMVQAAYVLVRKGIVVVRESRRIMGW